jgi:hypothetical protein
MREICTSGSMRDGGGNIPIYSASRTTNIADAALCCDHRCLGSGAPGDLFTPSIALGAPWRGTRTSLVIAFARNSACTVRCHRRRSCAGFHTRTDLSRRTHNGADRRRPIVHRANAAGSGHGNAGRSNYRAALDLRCTIDRRTSGGTAEATRAGSVRSQLEILFVRAFAASFRQLCATEKVRPRPILKFQATLR